MKNIVKPNAILEWATPDAIGVIERAGRTCYKSEEKITGNSSETFVRTILKSGHESVLEHAVASFRIICDRGVSHELVRHRIAAYSQESTRYCNYGKKSGISVIQPPKLSSSAYIIWESVIDRIEEAYLALLNDGCSPQIARSVLPNSLKTEIVATANFREWRHILKLRTSQKAHTQIKEVMLFVLDWFRKNYPVIVEDIV